MYYSLFRPIHRSGGKSTLEIRQLPTQMPSQVTIFRSLPRQKNAEAIPPVVP